MWISKKEYDRLQLEKNLAGGEDVASLKKQIRLLKDESEDLKTTKKMEQREIEHLVKLKEAKLDIEHQKTELKLKDSFKDKEMALQTDFFKKSTDQLETARKEMKDIHEKILERLPNITASLEVKKR